MLIKIWLKYMLGYLRISVEGYYIERFINICTMNKILIWNLKREKNVKLHLNIGVQDFYRAINVAKKLQCKVKIEKKRGIPFIINKYKKRKIFLISLIIIFVTLLISSNYIWNVEVQIEDNSKLENIEEDIKNAGLKNGMKKSQVNTEEIINKIRYIQLLLLPLLNYVLILFLYIFPPSCLESTLVFLLLYLQHLLWQFPFVLLFWL